MEPIEGIKFTEIEGICGACGSSIPKDEDHMMSQQVNPLFLMLPKPPTLRICKRCAQAMIVEWRRRRLAEFYSGDLFQQRHRKVLIMKELLMLQPRGPRLLVKRIDAPRPTSSLIEIPETADGEKSCYAVVIAIGNKITENIKVADTVILTQYCGSPVQVELDGETLDAQIIMQDDVLAVVE